MAAVSGEAAGSLHRMEEPLGGRDTEVSAFYADTRTPFQYDGMLAPRTGQCQDFLCGALQSPNAAVSQPQPVQSRFPPVFSSVIPVPRHRAPEKRWLEINGLDEAIAAAALTSLSSGPMALGAGAGSLSEACAVSSILSYSSGSSNGCDFYTSFPTTPSPPLQNAPLSAHSDAGLEDSDTTHFLFGDPTPRKRKNSGRLMFRCLWKNCGKVLSTSTAIQKHIRAVHLGRCGEQGHNDGEEDFYYTEMDVNVDTLTDGLSSLTPTSPTTSGPPPFLCPGSLGAANSTELPLISPLSLSAPSTLCHVHTDHAYQAPSPINVSVTPKMSLSWQPPPLLIKAPPARPTLSIGEKRPQILTATPNPKQVTGTRKPRGEAKKCRKVYGMERKEMWCTACRWKKACQRFID
ncbi:SLC2A4 regulator [Rana temporaria]|uniref:SLC2A4 regulator n=1 Tax=Rana temporaria TaxID=8407 RepID=UPI001AAE0FBE|nr:SLC2A4 regulator [Rana temporaria]